MREYHLNPQTQKWLASLILELPITEDKKTHKTVTISQYKNSRSTQMNKYFHVLRDLGADEFGYGREEFGSWLKGQFIGYEEINGRQIPKSSSKLDVQQFGDFLEHVTAFLTQQGLIIPAPPYQTYER